MRGTLYNFLTFFTGNNWEDQVTDFNMIEMQVYPTHGSGTKIMYGDMKEDFKHLKFHPDTDWHEYEIEWTPDYIQFSIDNEMVRREEGNEFVKKQRKAQNVIMSF